MKLHRDTGLALGVLGVVAAAYAATLCPSVYVEGSGELIGATWWPGTPHPTGYPLYVLLGRTLAWALPIASPARAVNAATAVGGAAAAALLFLLLRQRGCSRVAAIAASFLLAGGHTFWSQAVIAEVYTLFALACLVLLITVLKTRQGPHRRRDLLLVGYVGGLAATCHLQAVLLVPFAVAAALWPMGRLRPGQVAGDALKVAVGLAGGASVSLYLMVRNEVGPGFHWGPLDTLPAVWDHLTGALYRPAFQLLPLPVLQAAAVRLGHQLMGEWPTPVLAVVCWGLAVAWRRDRPLAAVLLASSGANVVSALTYHRDPSGLDVFFLLTLLAACVFAGFGFDDLWRRLRNRLGSGVATLLITLAAAAPAVNYRAVDRSRSWLPDRYGRALLAELPPDAILLTDGDGASYLVDYLHRIEGVRPDVDIYNRQGRGTDLAAEVDATERDAVRRQREARLLGGARPVRFVVPRLMPVAAGSATEYRFVPVGLTYRATGAATEVGPAPKRPTRILRPEDAEHPDPWYRKLAADVWFMEGEDLRHRGRDRAAAAAYVRAAQIVPESRTTDFNVALMLLRLNQLQSASEYALKAVDADPVRRRSYRLAEHILRRLGRLQEAGRVHGRALEWARIP